MLEIVAVVVFVLMVAGWIASLAAPTWPYSERIMWAAAIVLFGILLFGKYAAHG